MSQEQGHMENDKGGHQHEDKGSIEIELIEYNVKEEKKDDRGHDRSYPPIFQSRGIQAIQIDTWCVKTMAEGYTKSGDGEDHVRQGIGKDTFYRRGAKFTQGCIITRGSNIFEGTW